MKFIKKLSKEKIMAIRQKTFAFTLRRSKGYTNELEKLTRDGNGLNLTVNLKKSSRKKMRLRISGYSQAEYWYTLSNMGYTMTYKNYKISKMTKILLRFSRQNNKIFLNILDD